MLKRLWPLPDGQHADLNYFVNWRPWLWARPVADALAFLGDLRGKRLLEIGGSDARMTSLFALLGARVTMMDKHPSPQAETEIRKWKVEDRVRRVATAGGFDEIAGERFDAIFTKSVLWCIEYLAEFLDQIEVHLADGGKVAFVENYRGGRLHFWFRRNFVHRGDFGWEENYRGITPEQIDLFRDRFADLRARRYLTFVYGILGHKKRSEQ